MTPFRALPLHLGAAEPNRLLLAVLGVGAAFSVLVVLLSVAAYLRRRTTVYLLVAAAFSTFLGKTALGIVSVTGRIAPGAHHAIEHSLDAAMLLLVLVAVYRARDGVR
jgi:hypothetical protein